MDDAAQQERLRNKIIARLTKEGSSAEEPTNIDLTDYSSNEGDVSQESFSSEEERIEYADAAWSSEGGEFLASRRRYLCVPPPSPTFVPPKSVGLYQRRARRDVAERIYLERRRNLARRAMDLPTTDPGSDLCDECATDSADEGFVRSEGRECDVWRSPQEYLRQDIIELSETTEKEEQRDKSLILPEIVRPRSVSFGELLPHENHRKTRQQPRCLRTLRHPSPVSPTSLEVRLRLTSLKRQIWTGVGPTDANDAERLVDAFARAPLSWGVSRHALAHYPTDGEVTLKSRSKKTQSLVYDADKDDLRKARRKSRRSGCQLKTTARAEGQKPSRRKNVRLDWQRAVNLNSRSKDARVVARASSSLLTIEADSLKLLATSTTSRRPQRKLEPRRKFRGAGAVAATCANVGAKTGAAKPTRTCRRDAFCESTTSDDASSDSGKPKATKKKLKKKKPPPLQPLKKSTAAKGTAEQGRRACSAKTSRNNV